MSAVLDAALTRAMRESCLPEWHRETVRGVLEDDEDLGECCGNACDPCVLVLSRVVTRARELLAEREEAGAPPGSEAR